jgi:serine phosphatase RsbU (regulator of sigma subunit)
MSTAMAMLSGAVSLFVGGRGRHLARETSMLVEDAGLLERALLPEVPERVGPLSASVAYRPADGPGAGGDFYDVFPLDSGRVAAMVGDVSGHGRAALERATLMHYTLRAYLEAGLAPRSALELANEVRADGSEGEFATALIAIYDAAQATLSYACAGHPPPIVLGPVAHEPVTVCSSPPIGLEMPTALRQTTIAFPAGSTACLYTDGVAEARSGGSLLGRERLAKLVEECGSQATAAERRDIRSRSTDFIEERVPIVGPRLHADVAHERGPRPG